MAAPTAKFKARMILDTGATTTSLGLKVLQLVGYFVRGHVLTIDLPQGQISLVRNLLASRTATNSPTNAALPWRPDALIHGVLPDPGRLPRKNVRLRAPLNPL